MSHTSDREREILMSVLAGEASELERRLLRARRDADPEFDQEVQRIEWLWSAAKRDKGILHESSPPSPLSIIGSAELSAAASKKLSARGSGGRVSPERRRMSSWAIGSAAACLVLAIGLGGLIPRLRGVGALAPRVVVTGIDEIVTVALQDGTVVRLAPSSRLEFDEGAGRTVSLTGRAFFAVARRDGDPFQVRLPERTVTVLGTRFDVEGRDGRTRVAVVEGEVRISGAGNGPEVTARGGQIASGPDSGALVLEQVDDIHQTIDWLGGFLAFESTTLADAAKEIGDRTGLRVAIVDSALSPRTITGWFTDQTPEAMIAAICTAVGATCTIDGQDVRMELAGSADSAGP